MSVMWSLSDITSSGDSIKFEVINCSLTSFMKGLNLVVNLLVYDARKENIFYLQALNLTVSLAVHKLRKEGRNKE